MKCKKCHHSMKLTKKRRTADHYAWICRRTAHKTTHTSVRQNSVFSHSKVPFQKWIEFMYRFSQGLRLRQIDMMQDEIAQSSTTLSKMNKKLRDSCVSAMDRFRHRTGQRIGGRREFVAIDESHFRHKRKYGRGRVAGAWQRKKWVFGMLAVRRGKTRKPILRLVERRSRRHLVPIIQRHVKPGTAIISDEWRAYRVLSNAGYVHHRVNHSRWFVDQRSGAHTQHIERGWRHYKEHIWRLRGNRTESLLSDHLSWIEWHEWLGRKHHHGVFGRLLHDVAKMYR
ncbi:uncharacterized protein LOC134467092 [Engraulis encrasicolus]|uniref:uncharacterized protein LOC134467092 n=1 Tax=Engraulis encrasicolus TaxID=184585 RepID=UPI002FD3D43E